MLHAGGKNLCLTAAGRIEYWSIFGLEFQNSFLIFLFFLFPISGEYFDFIQATALNKFSLLFRNQYKAIFLQKPLLRLRLALSYSPW